MKSANTIFPFGTHIIYSNRWTNWSWTESGSPCDQEWFCMLTSAEATELRPGEGVWIKPDPIHPAGKVYGYQYVMVIQNDGNNLSYGVSDHATGSENYLITDKTELYQVVDEQKLQAFCAMYPQAMII